MKHGDLIEIGRGWRRRGNKQRNLTYRFRFDPVPFSSYRLFGKKWFYSHHRRPKTTQERKWSFEYTRAKRNKANLLSSWDDKLRSDHRTRRCWKNKKTKKQWMKNM